MHPSRTASCLLLTAALLIFPCADAQGPQSADAKSVPTPHSSIPAANTLLDGTPVKLRLAETVSSANATTGQEVNFEVVEDIRVDNVIVIRKGATALATVTEADHKKSMGRGGKLNLNIDSVRLVDNEKAQLKATAGGKGGGHTGAMTGAMVATGILFFPAAPLFLFIHGKDITLPKGLETTAFVDGDTPLNLAAFSVDPAAPGAPATAALSQVTISATTPDCDISVDGAFAGSTPSTLSLAPGKHSIVVSKKGFSDWQRTMQISGTAIRIQADMDNASPATAAATTKQ